MKKLSSLLAALLLAGQPLLAAYTRDGRSYVAGRFALMLDGQFAGWLHSAEGGHAVGEVVTEQPGATYFQKKHLGSIKYEDITIEMGLSMTKPVYDWISASWQMNYMRKNGAIVACDFKGEILWTREFFNALITETTIPAADASERGRARLTLKLSPEVTRHKKGDGSKIQGAFGANEQKLWLPSNFKLEVDGLPTAKVNKVEAITVKQKVVQDDIGDGRDYGREPGKLEFPNLKITLSQIGAQPWYDWHEDFVIQGNCGEDQEKGGRIVFLSPNRQEELLEVKFFNLGVFKLAEDKAEANSDAIKRISADLYCERMEFNYKNAVIP